jgi:hypothetical protein
MKAGAGIASNSNLGTFHGDLGLWQMDILPTAPFVT